MLRTGCQLVLIKKLYDDDYHLYLRESELSQKICQQNRIQGLKITTVKIVWIIKTDEVLV